MCVCWGTWGLQVGVLYWVGRGQKAGVPGQVTPRDETEGQGPHDRLDGEVLGEPDAGGSDWTWETCRDQTDSVMLIILVHIYVTAEPLLGYLRPDGIPVTCSQESSTGGGIAVVMVEVLMSPMMLSPSRRAWYILNISSRC